MSNIEVPNTGSGIVDVITSNYFTIDDSLREIFETHQTFEDEGLIDGNVPGFLLYDVIQRVVVAHTQYCATDTSAQSAAFEAFWLAVQIAAVKSGSLVFNPGSYFSHNPTDLYSKMATDALAYLGDNPQISTLIEEQIDRIDPSGVHSVMIESFAAVVIIQFELSQTAQHEDPALDLDRELAHLLFSVDPTSFTEET